MARSFGVIIAVLLFACTPANRSAALHFPVQSDISTDSPNALLTGTLIVEANCLRVRPIDNPTSYLIVWPAGYSVDARGDPVKVRNPLGIIVAVVGLPIEVSGGERPAADSVTGEAQFRQQYNLQCPGPYWMGSDVLE